MKKETKRNGENCMKGFYI